MWYFLNSRLFHHVSMFPLIVAVGNLIVAVFFEFGVYYFRVQNSSNLVMPMRVIESNLVVSDQA